VHLPIKNKIYLKHVAIFKSNYKRNTHQKSDLHNFQAIAKLSRLSCYSKQEQTATKTLIFSENTKHHVINKKRKKKKSEKGDSSPSMMCHHSSVGCWVLGHACEIM
jgi:hypothetical protein